MKDKQNKKICKIWIFIVSAIIFFGTVYLLASLVPMPYRIVTEYPLDMLLDETSKMHECAECHETEDFHSCETCHNEHGSAALSGLNFYSTVHLTGDVPEEKFISTNQIFLNDNQSIGQITINEFLRQNGIEDFTSVTFGSIDGGFTTVDKDQLGSTSFLLPYENGVRFADENLHVSTWIKGVSKIIVIQNIKDLAIDDQDYSIGQLMLMDTVRFTVEQAPVMLKSEIDGITRKGYTAERLEGIALERLLDVKITRGYVVTQSHGKTLEIDGEALINAKIVLIGNELTLVFPETGRSQWISGIVSIDEEE